MAPPGHGMSKSHRPAQLGFFIGVSKRHWKTSTLHCNCNPNGPRRMDTFSRGSRRKGKGTSRDYFGIEGAGGIQQKAASGSSHPGFEPTRAIGTGGEKLKAHSKFLRLLAAARLDVVLLAEDESRVPFFGRDGGG